MSVATRHNMVRPHIIAVGGGKGGVGKSLIASNLGVYFAQQNQRVLLFDADLGSANLHTCLGATPSKQTLSDFISHKTLRLSDIAAPTLLPNLSLISGAHDALSVVNLKYTDKLRLFQAMMALDVDYLIIDLGAGTSLNVIDFFLMSHHGILTIVPEPTSIENAYRFIRAVCFRRLSHLIVDNNWHQTLSHIPALQNMADFKTPKTWIDAVAMHDSAVAARMSQEITRYPLHVVVNQVRTAQEEQLGDSVCKACYQYFGVAISLAGVVPYDNAVWQATGHRQPLLLDDPHAPASMQLRAVGHYFALLLKQFQQQQQSVIPHVTDLQASTEVGV